MQGKKSQASRYYKGDNYEIDGKVSLIPHKAVGKGRESCVAEGGYGMEYGEVECRPNIVFKIEEEEQCCCAYPFYQYRKKEYMFEERIYIFACIRERPLQYHPILCGNVPF